MKWSYSIIAAFMPLFVSSSPINDADVTIRGRESNLFAPLQPRSSVVCIIKTLHAGSKVHCRAAPRRNAAHVTYVYGQDPYTFTCYSKGECIDNNWYICYPNFCFLNANNECSTWDWIPKLGCYVTGTLTDSDCSAGM